MSASPASATKDTQTAENTQDPNVPQVMPTAEGNGVEDAQDHAIDDTQVEEEPSHLDRLKDETKKDAALLEYVPLDAIEIITQNNIENTIPQTFEIGTAPGPNSTQLTLMACMATKGITTNTDGGWPRIMIFGIGTERFTKPHSSRPVESPNSTA